MGVAAKCRADLSVSRLAAVLVDGRGRSGGDVGLWRLCSSEKREGIVRLGSKERSMEVSTKEGTRKREEGFWRSVVGLSNLDGGEEAASGESKALKEPSGLSIGEIGDVGVDLLFRRWEYIKEFGAMFVLTVPLGLRSCTQLNLRSSKGGRNVLVGRHRSCRPAAVIKWISCPRRNTAE